MRKFFIQFKKSESGATLVEYGVALLLAIVLGGGALVTLANQTGANMNAACTSMSAGQDSNLCDDSASETPTTPVTQ